MEWVFWVMVLLNLKPSDGHGTMGLYTKMFDIYGEKLENLQPGDVLERNDFELILIFDKEHYFQFYSEGKISPDLRDIYCTFIPYPRDREDAKWKGRFKKIGTVPNPKVTFALAKRLANKWLPYHPADCRKIDYMKYILYGQTKQTVYWPCPLYASLKGVTEKQIEEGKFAFRDRYKHHIYDFPSKDGPKTNLQNDPPTKKISRQQSGGKSPSCFGSLWARVKRSRQSRYDRRLRRVASSSSRMADNLDEKVKAEKRKEKGPSPH